MMAQDVEVASSFQPLLGLAANFLGSHESQVADPMIEAEWISVGIVPDSVGRGVGAVVFGASGHHAVLGIARHVRSETRQTSSGGSALVSGVELLEDWLELGDLCADKRL